MLDPSASVFRFSSKEHPSGVLAGLQALREKGDLCDILLCAEGREFPAHKAVLCGCSSYFTAMFTGGHVESRGSRVTLNGVDSYCLEVLLDYMYTGSLEITQHNVQALLAGSSLLGLVPVTEACCEFLKVHLEVENCLGIAAFADMHSCAQLSELSWRFAMEHFPEVSVTEEFVSLPAPILQEVVKFEDLNVHSEVEVLESVLRWYKHDEEERNTYLPSVLQQIKLPLVPWKLIVKKLLSDSYISSQPDCLSLIAAAKKFQFEDNEDAELYASSSDYARYVPRKSANSKLFVYVVGGETDPGRATISSMELYDPARKAWKDLAPMQTHRRGVGVGILDGLLYAVGGSDGLHALKRTECYHPKLDRWETLADMNVARSSVAAAILNGYFYAIGGYDGSSGCLRSVERYNPATDTWTFVANMTVGRSMMGVATLGDNLCVVGGYDGSSDLSSCECYGSEDNKWSLFVEMNVRRCMAGVAVLGGLLYAVGGCDCSCSLSSVEVYNPSPDARSWTLIASMAKPRSGVGVAVVGQLLYAVGGNTGKTYSSSVECYDPESKEWTFVSKMKMRRRRFGCCS